MGGKIPPISFKKMYINSISLCLSHSDHLTQNEGAWNFSGWRVKALKAEVSPSERKMCLLSFTTFTVSISWAKDWEGSSSNHLSDPCMTHFLTGLFEDTLPPHILEQLRGEHSHSIGKVTHYWPQACKREDGYESKGKLEKKGLRLNKATGGSLYHPREQHH